MDSYFWNLWKEKNLVTQPFNIIVEFPMMNIVVAGAGSAGIGVLNASRKTMARMLGNNETAFDSAQSQIWVADAQVREVKLDVLLGLSAVGGLFSKETVGHQDLLEGYIYM